MPPFDTETDLRSWIATLEAAGELKRVPARVDWDKEIGAITRANMALGGPALIFENIRDHSDTPVYAVDDLRSFHAPTRSPDGGPVTQYRG